MYGFSIAICIYLFHTNIDKESAPQAEWEDLNRTASNFAAIQQLDKEEDDDIDDAMAEDKAPSKTKVNPFASQSTDATSNPVIENPAPVDEDDEIT